MKRTTSSSRFWLLAVLAVFFAFAVAACGGDGEGTGETTGQDGEQQQAAPTEITINWGAEPPSLDPGLATDVTSSNILQNIMDPLVKLDPQTLEPVPTAAESVETSEDGLTVTITLKDNLMWTNGDPVTAQDYEYSWLRTISPELAADYAYQFFGIKGASEYNSCDPAKADCEALREQVGIQAVDDRTLEVTLASPQPWFAQQLAHHSFLAVHQETVEQFGERWTEPENIVTNGPFKLAVWEHDSRIDLEKWADWRDADSVHLERVNGRMIVDGVSALQAFEAGEVDVTLNVPTEELSRLKAEPFYQQYPGLGTYYYGFNVENVSCVDQRRAMAMAIPRQTIIDNIAQADQLPATGFSPQGLPGFDNFHVDSPYLPVDGDIEQAKQLLENCDNVKENIRLFLNDSPGHREIAVAIQDAWSQLGLNTEIQVQEWAQFLEFLGPPPADQVDVYRLGWIGDYVDAFNFLELWTCDSGNNHTNFCSEEYDNLIQQIREGQVTDEAERYDIYRQLEEILVGENGEMPIAPIYWYTYVTLENEEIKDTFNVNLLDQIDLTDVGGEPTGGPTGDPEQNQQDGS